MPWPDWLRHTACACYERALAGPYHVRMNLFRLLLRVVLGRRLPITTGELRVPGLAAPITIRRDSWGVPHIDAESDADAAFAIGFCHGQDRGGQLEILWRVCRGRLAEWVGKNAIPTDRMSRRIGFRRAAEAQIKALAPHESDLLEAFARGVNAGNTTGLTAKPHEFAILGGEPSKWDGADVLALLKLQSFLLPSNWDAELARLRLLRSDGPEAVTALDPSGREGVKGRAGEGVKNTQGIDPFAPSPAHPFSSEPLLGRLAADLAALQRHLGRGGGSNNWAIAGSRTASGKPILASDPHLSPTAPPPWYLVHVRTPDWEIVGANLTGTPAFPIGQTATAAWGVTAGLTDNTDLFLETLGPDGASVREADGTFTPCKVIREMIRVKGAADVTEDVLLTPRGPIITPLLGNIPEAVSLRAVWLDPLPVVGFLGAHRAQSFDEFRRCFAAWPVLPLNVLYADAGGTIGWQLIGELPQRIGGNGTVPLPSDSPNTGWAANHVPFDRMPHTANPEAGFLATANDDLANLTPGPSPEKGGEQDSSPPSFPGKGVGGLGSDTPFLGIDFVDPYRARVIRDELGKRTDWDVAGCVELQQSVRSLPWEEVRAVVLSLVPADPDAREGLTLLREWDGRVTADSPAAAVFELFVAEMIVRVAKAIAPKGWRVALGESGLGPVGHNLFTDRRVGHLVRLLHEQPAGVFPDWQATMLDVLAGVVKRLRRKVGPGSDYWAWGHLRQLRLDHPLFKDHWLLGRAFNLGPVPVGGDSNTVSQAGTLPLDPTAFTHNMANLRAVFDLAEPGNSRFVLCGGQSGNPCSPHHADQFPLWQAGEMIPIPRSQEVVIRQAKAVLRLVPT